MAGSRSQTLLRPSRDWTPLTQIGALTLSAGVITDDTRLAGVQGDGATYPASMAGVWPAATNLITNGGFETNTTGWVANNSCTLSRDTTQAKFGSACLKLVSGNAGTQEGATLTNSITVTNGATYTASVWVWGSGTIRVRLTDVTVSNAESSDIVLSSTPQRVTVTYTMQATTAKILIKTTTQQSVTYYVDGVQLETGSIPTPYIETDGGTASRVAGQIQMPVAGLFTATQGWIAARLKLGRPTSSAVTAFVFEYGDAFNRNILVQQVATNDGWQIQRRNSDSPTPATVVAAKAVGDFVTVVAYWTATTCAVSIDGSAFDVGANTSIPTLSATLADIGKRGTANDSWMYSNYDWFVAGEGLLAASDPALFHAWGNNDPLPHMLPRAAQPTALMHANGDGTMYRYAA